MNWKYAIPMLLCACFIFLSAQGYYYLIFIVLFLANILNVVWGEFSNIEIKQELSKFYGSAIACGIKRCSAFLLILFLVWGIYFASTNGFSYGQIIGFGICFGLLAGCFSVTLSHELLHSTKITDKILSTGLLLGTNIPHLAIDHVYGHHRVIGLKEDVTSAKLNQSFYHYFWSISIARFNEVFFRRFALPGYAKKRIAKLALFMGLLQLSVWAIILLQPQGKHAFLFFIIQGFVAYLLYELINYIQHYGLVRAHKNEPIGQQHSWNCYHKYSNYILYFLPLHSLHHLSKPDRKQAVEDLKAGPKMPYLYFAMISLALVPPLWFKKMITKYSFCCVVFL